jgi:hypothetical protein
MEIQISNDPITGAKRKLVFAGLSIHKDFNMQLKGQLEYYDDNDQRMTEVIEQDETLTRSQKIIRIQQFLNRSFEADTTGIWVDKNGEPVKLIQSGDQGNITTMPPEGAVPELEFWQNLSLSYFLQGQGLPDDVMKILSQIKFSSLFYGAIEQSMKNLDNRNRF